VTQHWAWRPSAERRDGAFFAFPHTFPLSILALPAAERGATATATASAAAARGERRRALTGEKGRGHYRAVNQQPFANAG